MATAGVATGVVVADALLFEGATTTLIDDVAGSEGRSSASAWSGPLLFRALTDYLRAPEDAAAQAHVFGPAIDSVLRHLSLA